MAESDIFKRYLETGLALGQMTRVRAEALAKDLVRVGEIQREQAQDWVEDLVERSRKNTEVVVELVRTEVARQVSAMGVLTKQDLSGLLAGLVAKAKEAMPATSRPPTTTRKASAAKKTVVRKAAGKKAATTRKASAAKKTVVRKAAGKKAATTRKASAAKAGPA
ncbi:MAG: hypothetical protein ACYCS7_10950 [Acidimicrobiales bacterium]